MSQAVSLLTAWLGGLNRRQLLFLHFVVSSAGLIKISILISGSLDLTAQLAYVQVGLSDWAQLTGMNKFVSLWQFILPTVALFTHYAIFVALSKVFSSALSEHFPQEQLPIVALHFLISVVLNGVLIIVAQGIVILAGLWLVVVIWFPFYCLHDRLHVPVLSSVACGILLTLISLQYAAIFCWLILDPMLITNDYLNISEKTVLKSGKVVDNMTYINEHRIAGYQLYDPRVDGGRNPPPQLGTKAEIKDCRLVSRYLRAASEENKYKYGCDNADRTLIVRPPMTLNEKAALDTLQLSAADTVRLGQLFVSSSELGNAYKNHVYSDDEKDFIERNVGELLNQAKAGWFFYHHSYFFGPMNALSLGAGQYSQAMVYGWLNTVTVGALLDRFGMMNYQGYFKAYFSAYLVYFTIFLFGVWAIFQRVGSVLFAAILSISALFLLGIEFIRLAPGFNPLRHFFDIAAFYLFYLYLSRERKLYLVFACLLALFAILWSKDFGLFLTLSIGGAALFRALGRIPIQLQRVPALIGGATILAGLILYFYPMPGRNPAAIYMILGAGAPPTSTALILGALGIVNILLVAVIAGKQRGPYKILTIALLFYSVQSIIYLIWYPSWHHILGIAPVHILLLVALFHGWSSQDRTEKNLSARETLALAFLLLLIYLPGAVHFYWKQDVYYRTFKNHQLYNWSFEKASFITTMEPFLFVEAARLIKQYSPKDKGIFIISKYDHILPILAEKYSAMPYIELPTNLVSVKEAAVAANAILKNRPSFLFVDSDINRSLNSEIPVKQDPASVMLGLYGEAKSRAMVLQGLNDVYSRVANEYWLCRTGRLISVYCLKSQ